MANTSPESPTTIVTGGGQGIGRGTVEYLLNAGHNVVCAELNLETIDDTRAALGSFGEQLMVIATDVTDEAQVVACIDTAVERFGGISGLVNNAGLPKPRFKPPQEMDWDTWYRVLEVNLTGAMRMCRAVIEPMRKHGGGSIVNIASTRALQSEPNGEAYAASKGGLLSLTHALAMSLGPEIRVNAICPGWIDVSMYRPGQRKPRQWRDVDHAQHPAGRIGHPDDIAAMIRHLLSGDAAFITGQHFVIDGGMSRKMIYEH